MHSKVSASNLFKIVDEDGTVVVCIKEIYVICNKIAGIPRKNLRNWGGTTGIVVTNNQIDSYY